MSILLNLKKVKKERSIKKHPLADLDLAFRFGYASGCAMLAFADGDVNEQEKLALETLVLSLQLTDDYLERVLAAGQSAESEMIHAIIESLTEKEFKLIYLLDLYRIAYSDRVLNDEERETIDIFYSLLELTEVEQEFCNSFSKLSFDDNENPVEALKMAYDKGFEPPFEPLRYFVPSLSYQEEVEGFSLENGQERKLARPFKLVGNIYVGTGSELDISNTEIIFGKGAKIFVDGGVLKMDSSKFIATAECEGTLLSIQNVLQMEIKNVSFEGNHTSRAISSNNSMIDFYSCIFRDCFHVENGGSINSTNSRLKFKNCTFNDCESLNCGGVIFYSANTQQILSLEDCTFTNGTANYGGAIYIKIAKMVFLKTIFQRCSAKDRGGALYLESNGEIKDNKELEFINCRALKNGGAINIINGTNISNRDQYSFINCEPNNIF